MNDHRDPSDRDEAASLTPNDIRQVLDVLANSSWDEAVVTVGDVTIAVARNGARLPASVAPSAVAPAPVSAPAPAPAPTSAPAPAPAPITPAADLGDDAVRVSAPSVGVFWASPEPGAAPFVQVGDRVEAGQEMCIVEVMKLMNRVHAPIKGTVVAVHVANGEPVQFGTDLYSLSPA